MKSAIIVLGGIDTQITSIPDPRIAFKGNG